MVVQETPIAHAHQFPPGSRTGHYAESAGEVDAPSASFVAVWSMKDIAHAQ